MITLVLKYWRLIIDALIVIAICVAFSYFDPFHLFRKAKLEQTANMISNIKSIGQLITAEYYGEVIASENEELKDESIDYEKMASNFYNDARDAVEVYQQTADLKRDDISTFPSVTEMKPQYSEWPYLVWYFGIKLTDNESRINRWYEKGKLNKIEENLFTFILKNNKEVKNEMLKGFVPFIKTKKQLHEQDTRVKQKDEIILIGRGSVKAGFDFGQIDERNVLYNKQTKQIKLYGLSVQVLDTILNPWFIPEIGVEGYVFVNSPKTTDYSKVIAVKNKCRVKLAQQALKAGLTEQALENGHEVLRNFFSVLLNEPELTVSLSDMPYQQMLDRIMADDTISKTELCQINELLMHYNDLLSKASPEEKQDIRFELQIIINNLKYCTCETDGRKLNPYQLVFNQLSDEYKLLPPYYDDRLYEYKPIDSMKYFIIRIIQIRDTITENDKGNTSGLTTRFIACNPYWYSDTSVIFIKDYNAALESYLRNHPKLQNNTLFYPAYFIPSSAFDTIPLSQIKQVDSLVIKYLKPTLFCIAKEYEVIKKVEAKNARYRQEIKPLNKFTRFVHENNPFN